MYKKKSSLLFAVLLLTFPSNVGGGRFCYYSCLATIGGAAFLGTAAILPILGFTTSGIAAGSWAATWMASFAGSVPAGSLFSILQSAGMTGATKSATVAITGSATALCTILCSLAPKPVPDHFREFTSRTDAF